MPDDANSPQDSWENDANFTPVAKDGSKESTPAINGFFELLLYNYSFSITDIFSICILEGNS